MALGTYLVEHYRPGVPVDDLRHAAELLRAAVAALDGEGSQVRYVGSTIVPDDEAFLSLFEASSQGVIEEAYRRAGVPFERISPALPADT